MNTLVKCVEALLAALLFGMVVMVFGNVVLRYVFNSGLLVSEELSRFFFIWLVFVGGIVAMWDGSHIIIDSVTSRLTRRGKLLCAAVCQLLILLCCALLFYGAWQQHEVNATTAAPVTGLSMIWVFGMAYLVSLCIGTMALWRLARILSGRITDAELENRRGGEDVTPVEPVALSDRRAGT